MALVNTAFPVATGATSLAAANRTSAASILARQLLALPPGQMADLYKALRYERFYLASVGVTLALGLYLTIAAFTA